MSDPAVRYCSLARIAIRAARSPADLKQWWRSETIRRHQYLLTPEQTADLASQCGVRSQEIARMQTEVP